MSADTYIYPHQKHLTIAGYLALAMLVTACIYEWSSTPFSMVLFLMGGATFLFAAVVLFAFVIWRDVRARLASLTTRSFAAGEVVFHQGDPAEHVFIITKGRVEAVHTDPVKGEIVLGRLETNDYFGETAILNRHARQATVRALTEVELLSIHRVDFLRLYGSLPRLRAQIEAQQTKRRALLKQP
jgi:hypothetical protein